MSKPKHSVVMCTYITTPEQLEMTKKAIACVKENADQPFEFIIVETCSKHLEKECDVYIHEDHRPISRSTRAINRGMGKASGEYITFVSNDVFVPKDYLGQMEDCFKKFSDCGAATLGSTQNYPEPKPVMREFNYWPIAMVSRVCWYEVGGFDENIWGTWNDTDFVMRMYEKGYKMYQNLSVFIEHLIKQTEGLDEDRERVYERNRRIFERKHQYSQLHYKFLELAYGVVNHENLVEYANDFEKQSPEHRGC